MPFRKRVSLGFFCAVGCLLPMAYIAAKPTGFQLRSGEALPPVQTESGAFVIESGKYAAIDWEKFSIDAGEHLEFQQFDSKSYVVNRVLGPKASELLGKLSSNGAVYLINPNGVFIGSQALIETAGFIASTLDLLEARDQELHFAGMSEERIVNEGAIRCEGGDVFLIGRTVENSGTIEALREGLISGCDVMISSTRAPCVHIRARGDGDIDSALLEKNPYAIAIRHSGLCKAREVYLSAEEGTAEVGGQVIADQNSGEGIVHVLGEHVHLLDGVRIDASGEFGGGTILIGGDYQGKNESVKNAQHTWIGKDAVVRADALEEGNGGKIIFWGDKSMVYHGSASACGGTQGGNGGLIEVSGKKLQFEGKASTAAPFGRIGTLLLDPTNIVISTGGDSGGSFGGCTGGTNTYTPSNAVSNTINTTTLGDLLDAPCNVTISTVGSPGGGTGSITVSNPLTWSEATTLTLTAASFITVAASITNSSASTGFTALHLTSNGSGATTNPGIWLSGGTISTTGGDVILEGTSSTATNASHGVLFNGGRIATGSGNISVTGLVPVGAMGNGVYGIYMNTVNGIQSSTGNISLSGTTNTSGSAQCWGIFINQTWTTMTTGTLFFQNCVGGLGGNNFGVVVGGAISTSGNIIATNTIQSGLGNNTGVIGGFYTSRAISSSGGNIQITASVTTIGGLGTGIVIDPLGSISTTGNGNITLIGTGGSTGVWLVSGSSGVTTVNGTINVVGNMPGGSQTGIGVSLEAANAFKSTTGLINVSGTSSATGPGSHGVSVTAAWTTGTTGTVTFAGCQGGTGQGSHGVNLGAAFVSSGDVVFSNCVGGTNNTTGGNGINVGAAFSTAGNISAVATIQGQGNGGDGFASGSNFATTGSGKTISITASGTGTAGACHGITLTGGTMNSPSGTITLIGTSGASSDAASFGVNLASAANSITSTSGAISVSGTSLGTAAGSHGVAIAAAWTPTTSGTVTFTGTGGNTGASHGVNLGAVYTGVSPVIFSSCTGGTGGGSGINVGATFTTTGSITATNSILGQGAGGIGFASNANFSGSTITITASANGTTGASHGISITGGSLSTSTGTITLIGTSGASSTASFGVNLASAANSITSTSGAISVSGTSFGTAAGSHGVAIAAAWTPTTSGTVTFTGTGGNTGASHGVNLGAVYTGVSPVIFSSCTGGTGGGNGINVGATFTTTGSITATNSILGQGAGGIGFASNANFSSSTITITASANGTTGASHGISITGGSLSTSTGTITLIGTSGASSTASFGVNLASVANSITSTSGTISITGISQGIVAGSNGISINTNPWAAGTTATLSLTGTAGSTGVSYGIDKGQALTSNGPIVFNGNSGGGSGSYGNRWNGNITTSGDSVTTFGSTFLASAVVVDTTNGSAAGADIVFSGSTATIDGGADLTLHAGTGGAVTFGGAIGQIVPLGNLTITSAKTTLNAVNIGGNITASSFTITTASPATLTGSSIIDVSAAAGGSISFPSTIDGTSAGAQNLTLTANATGTVTLAGSVGTNIRLGDMSISGGASGLTIGSAVTNILANSFTVGGTVPTTLQNSALLTIDTSGGTGSIAFGGTITGTSAQALTLTTSGTSSVTLFGNVGAPLGALTVGSGTGDFVVGSGVTSIQASSFTVGGTVPTTLQNSAGLTIDTSSSNGTISFGGTIDGTVMNAQDLTLTPGIGNIVLTGAVGGNVALGSILIPNATNVTANAITATSLTQSAGVGTTTFNGALTISSDIDLTGNNFAFNAPVNADNVSISNLGLLAIAAAADMTLSGSFSQTPGLVQTAGDITTSGQNISFGGAVTLTGDVALDTGGMAGAISFIGTVNGGFNLVLDGGSITFFQAVGGVPLLSLDANAATTIDIYGNQTVSSGPMLYRGEVILHGTSITLTDSGASGIQFDLPMGASTTDVISGNTNLILSAPSSSITINGDVDLTGSGGAAGGNLTVSSATSLSTTGDIDLSGSDGANGGDGGNMTVTTSANLSLSGQVLSKGGAGTGTGGVGGNVSLTSTSGSVSVHNINVSGGSGTPGGDGGSITLQAAPGYTGGFPDGLIILNSDLSSGSDGNLVAQPGLGALSGTILLSSNRSFTSTVATIVSSSVGNDVSIIGSNIGVGVNEAMTVLGNLELIGNTITLSDTVALGDLSILGNTVNLLTHGSYIILSSEGSFYITPTLHFLGGSGYLQTGTLVPSTGPLNAQNLGLSPSTFRPLLFFDGHILNYDTTTPPPPPPPSPPTPPPITTTPKERAFARYQLAIADAQLSDLLPTYSLPFAPIHYYWEKMFLFEVGRDSPFLKILP